MADFDIKYSVKPDEASIKAGAQKIKDSFQDTEIKVGIDKSEINKNAKYIQNEFEDAGHKAGKGFGEKFKTGFGGVGNIVAGLGIANLASGIFSFVKDSAAASIELDKQVKNIGTLGVANFEEFAARATELSKTVPDSAANIAGAVYDAVSAGISGTNDDIMNFVGVASKAAVAGMTDTGVAVNGLTSILNAYKLPVTDAARVSDEFFAGVKLGKLTFEEFVAGAGEVVPTAAALGVGFNEVSASVATITSQGVKAPQAFTKLNQLMIELQKPGTELAKVMKNVTVTIGGVPQALTASNIGGAIKAQGLTKTLQDIEVAARASGKSMTQVFSSSEASAASLLLTGNNAAFANKMLKNLNDEVAKGAANAAFQVANTSIENQFKLLKNNLQAALQPIFADILPIIGELAKQIAIIFQNKEIKEAFKSLTVIISTLLKTVVPPLMNVLAPLLASVLKFIEPVAKQLGDLIGKILPITAKLLAPIIDMLPLIGAAIGTILDAIIPIITTLQGEFQSVITELLYQLLPVIIRLMTDWAAILKELTPVITMIAKVISGILTIGIKALMPVIMEAVKEIGAFTKSVVGIINVVGDVASALTVSGGAYKTFTQANQLAAVAAANLVGWMRKQVEAHDAFYKAGAKYGKKIVEGTFVATDYTKIAAVPDDPAKPTPTAGEKSAIKTTQELLDLAKKNIALLLQKGNLNIIEKAALDALVKKAREYTDELKKQKDALEQAERLINGKTLDLTDMLTKSDVRLNPLEKKLTEKLGTLRLPSIKVNIEVDYFAESLKSLLPEINNFASSFGEAMAGMSKETKKALNEQMSDYDADAVALKKSLLAKEISFEEYENKTLELEKNKADAVAAAVEESNKRIVDAYNNLTKSIQDEMKNLFTGSFKKILDDAEENSKITGERITIDLADVVDVGLAGIGLAVMALGSELGTMMAEGGHSFTDYLKQMAISVINTVQVLMNAWAAALLVKNNAEYPFGLGMIPFALTIAGANALLALAKGALGAEEGVIGIDRTYNKQRGSTDTIPLWVAPGETIFSRTNTDKHRDLFVALQGGISEERYFAEKYGKMQNLNYGNDNKIYAKLIKTIESGISVRAENFHNIKIVDKTGKGIKAMPFK